LDQTPPGPTDEEPLSWLEHAKIKYLVLSRLTGTKNIISLLKTIEVLQDGFRRAQARLLIVGDGPEKHRLRTFVHKANLGDSVAFAPITGAPSPYLKLADYLVIVSSSEGGPLTAFEAIIAGTGLLSTSVGVVPEIARLAPESVTIFDGHDEESIRTVIMRTLQEDPTSARSRRASIAQLNRFSAGSCASAFYAELLSRTV
jgi:glycosyltransferase involved in cell wall biosynthesis